MAQCPAFRERGLGNFHDVDNLVVKIDFDPHEVTLRK